VLSWHLAAEMHAGEMTGLCRRPNSSSLPLQAPLSPSPAHSTLRRKCRGGTGECPQNLQLEMLEIWQNYVSLALCLTPNQHFTLYNLKTCVKSVLRSGFDIVLAPSTIMVLSCPVFPFNTKRNKAFLKVDILFDQFDEADSYCFDM